MTVDIAAGLDPSLVRYHVLSFFLFSFLSFSNRRPMISLDDEQSTYLSCILTSLLLSVYHCPVQ